MELHFMNAAFTVIIIFLMFSFLLFYIYKFHYHAHPLPTEAGAPAPYVNDLINDKEYLKCFLFHTREGYSSKFFDADQYLSDRNNLMYTQDWLISSIAKCKSEAAKNGIYIDGIAFVEKDSGPIGLITLQHLISYHVNMKSCSLRIKKSSFLPQAAIKGFPPLPNTNWIVISDVATSGGHLKNSIELLKHPNWNAHAPYAIILLNRGGSVVREELEKLGTKLIDNQVIYKQFETEVPHEA